MITRTTFAGFGGQGVLLMGYVLSHGAMHKGLNVTYFPSYGAEMRGGTANCTVTISDHKIASPVASNPEILVAMNGPSLDKFEAVVAERGLVFMNTSLIKREPERSDLELIRIPTVELAKEVGSERAPEHDHDRGLLRAHRAPDRGGDLHRHGGRPQGPGQVLCPEPIGHRARVFLSAPGSLIRRRIPDSLTPSLGVVALRVAPAGVTTLRT